MFSWAKFIVFENVEKLHRIKVKRFFFGGGGSFFSMQLLWTLEYIYI